MTAIAFGPLPPPPHHLLTQATLFLDLDGTLIEFARRPGDVRVSSDVIDLLNGLLVALGGRVVMVSGRPAAEVRGLLSGVSLAIAGSHGAELQLASGLMQKPADVIVPDAVMSRVRGLADAHPGVLVEQKPFGLALHYRLAPKASAACMQLAQQIAAEDGYGLQAGRMVIELKFHGADKGDAVRSFMAVAPFQAGKPLFLGDDLTDEAGFAAALELGGAGVLVGPVRPTHAAYRLAGVGSALGWLRDASARTV